MIGDIALVLSVFFYYKSKQPPKPCTNNDVLWFYLCVLCWIVFFGDIGYALWKTGF